MKIAASELRSEPRAEAAEPYPGLLESVALAANQAGELKDALELALARICEATGWKLGHALVATPDGETGQPSPVLEPTGGWYGAAGEAYAPLRAAALTEGPFAGLPGRVVAMGRAAWITDLGRGGEDPRAGLAAAAGLRAAFAFPVMAGRAVAAVLEFFSDQAQAPDAALVRVLAQAGRQLGKVAERQWRQRRLEYDASHDALTGLPNRTLFLDRLGRVLARGRRGASAFAVLLLDLDRFHVVNDSLGHAAGDALLLMIAERLSGGLRSSDMIARWPKELARLGGDVFTVLLEDLPHDSDALRVAERLQESLAPPLTLGGRQFFITASVGIAIGAADGDAGRVLHEADLAMSRAKALGGARAELYDQTLHAAAVERMHLETGLRQALSEEQFVLHYQPIVALADGSVQGVEALVRWRRTGKELVYPADFIPAAEATGLILPLGLWVLREACVAARLWQREFPAQRRLGIGVNLSARQFAQPDLAAQVEQILRETGIEPATVRLEITESALLGAPEAGGNDAVAAVFAQLKALGVEIGLDDFGTGYSSLSYLQRFPLDIVKIDRSFVSQLGSERDSEAIVRTILDLARNLNLRAVAEGAETAEQVERLRALGCPLAQGYYFARPMDAAHLRAFLAHAA